MLIHLVHFYKMMWVSLLVLSKIAGTQSVWLDRLKTYMDHFKKTNFLIKIAHICFAVYPITCSLDRQNANLLGYIKNNLLTNINYITSASFQLAQVVFKYKRGRIRTDRLKEHSCMVCNTCHLQTTELLKPPLCGMLLHTCHFPLVCCLEYFVFPLCTSARVCINLPAVNPTEEACRKWDQP